MKELTKEQAMSLVLKIEMFIKSGDSIGVARSKVCKGILHTKDTQLTRHPYYIAMLNKYMRDTGKNIQYRHNGIKLEPIK